MSEFQIGQKVFLNVLPPGLLGGLLEEDQVAIQAIIGHPVTLAGYSYGQAELEFVDSAGDEHTIWVEPSLLQASAQARQPPQAAEPKPPLSVRAEPKVS